LGKVVNELDKEAIIMDSRRVKQILSSSADIHVEYNGTSVWIDELHEDGKTATVHLRGPLEERSTVDISELEEV
jgi:small acid-soluble spore protein H (minor)